MNALALQRNVIAPLEFTPEQRKIILNSFLNGATEAEAAVLLELARLRRLNPITREIHFVKRWDTDRNCFVWSAQVGIDGFRTIAERTGLYDGQDEPEFGYAADGKQLLWCKVRIYRKDWSRPAVGVAHFSEYAQVKKDGSLTKMWREKQHVMLAKCAEAQGHRKAFPGDTSGLYAPEEMPDPEAAGTIGQRMERDVNAPPPPPPALQAQTSVQSMPTQTEKVAAKVAAKVGAPPATPPKNGKHIPIVECDANGKPKLKVTFGASKGKMLCDLTVAELSAAITFGEEKLGEAPSAEWAAPLAACLADLKQEHGARIEKLIEAEAAEKAANAKSAPEPGSEG